MTRSENFDSVLIITRTFDAPRDLVWRAWTEAQHIAAWWGPEGFATRVEEQDFRVGGKTQYVMVEPDGTEYPAHGVIKEVVPLERIVTTDEFGEGHEGPEGGELPQITQLTVQFEEAGFGTRVSLRIAHPTPEDRRKHEQMGVVGGWQSSFDCLDRHLKPLV